MRSNGRGKDKEKREEGWTRGMVAISVEKKDWEREKTDMKTDSKGVK